MSLANAKLIAIQAATLAAGTAEEKAAALVPALIRAVAHEVSKKYVLTPAAQRAVAELVDDATANIADFGAAIK